MDKTGEILLGIGFLALAGIIAFISDGTRKAVIMLLVAWIWWMVVFFGIMLIMLGISSYLHERENAAKAKKKKEYKKTLDDSTEPMIYPPYSYQPYTFMPWRDF